MNALRITFDQFTVQLLEWADAATIYRYYAECFALYAANYPATQVGPLLREKIRGQR